MKRVRHPLNDQNPQALVAQDEALAAIPAQGISVPFCSHTHITLHMCLHTPL